MAINSYNIGPDYSSLFTSSQNVKPSKNEGAGGGAGGDTDLGRTANKADQNLGMVAGAANTINNVANVYEEWNRGPRTGNNVGDTNTEGVSTGNNIGDDSKGSNQPKQIEVSKETPNNYVEIRATDDNTITSANTHLNNLQKNWGYSYEEQDRANITDFNDIPQGKGNFYTIQKNGDNANVKGNTIKFNDELYKQHDLGDVGLNWWTARNVALPVLNYAAQYNQLDSKNKWLQAGMTTQRIMQNFAGKDPQTNLYRPTVLDDYYISNFVELADLSANWSDRNAWQNAMAGAQSAVDMIKNFGWEDYVGGKETLGQMADGLAYLNFGNSIYQLGNNWSSMNAEERTAAVVQTLYAGVQAYNGGSLLINTFAPAAQVATPSGAAAAGGSAAVTNTTTSGTTSVVSSSGGSTASSLSTPATGVGEYTSASTGAPITEGGMAEANLATSGQGTITTAEGNAAMNEMAMGGEQAGNVGGNAAGSTVSTLGGSFMAVVGAYSMAKGIEGLHQVIGTSSAANRKAGAMAGMSTGVGAASLGIGAAVLMGASIGSSVPIIGTIIGAVVGAVVGVVSGSVNTGASKEKHARDNWRAVYGQAGIFSRAPVAEGSSHHTYAMQLADGRWYDVGHDGSGSRATFINGDVKYVANPDRLTAEDRHRMVNDKHGTVRAVLPYNVDYTNDLDFVGSMMLSGMIVPVGGSYQKNRTAEVPQMLGYMTNGITSNCGREFSLANYQIMAANAKALYAKMGITNKTQMVNSMGEAYLYGQLNYQDYMSSLTAANLMYDENGYQQAQAMMAGMNNQPQVPSNN